MLGKYLILNKVGYKYMKLQVMSDLHLEFEEYQPIIDEADVLILAGDIWVGKKGIDWVKKYLKGKDCMYVLGNHEYWKKAHPKLLTDLKDEVKNTNIHVLENDVIKIDNVNFFGATLWTDYNINNDPHGSKLVCWSLMNDFKKIRISPKFAKFEPDYAIKLHENSKRWLHEELSARKGEKNVVITHNSPSAMSLPLESRGDIYSAAYASNLESLIYENQPNLWCHGHIHSSSDYMIGDTRVVCNPRGNPYSRNLNFKNDLIIEI